MVRQDTEGTKELVGRWWNVSIVFPIQHTGGMEAQPKEDMTLKVDAIIVGARVAGCATALALAKRGWRVALVERKRRPLGSTLSLPITQPRGLARFRDLGLFPVIESIMPHLRQIRSYDMRLAGNLTIVGNALAAHEFDYGVILRREVLDDALLDFVLRIFPDNITLYEANVDALLFDDRTGQVSGVTLSSLGTTTSLCAPLVIGADGRFSRVAHLVGAKPYHVRSSSTTLFYSYCRGIDTRGLADITFRSVAQNRLVVFSEIGDGLQSVSAWFPVGQFDAFRRQPKGELCATYRSDPELAERMKDIQFEGKVMGLSPHGAEGYFRPAGGPGWALVGDARHYKDPASGQGLHDALYSVQQLLRAVDQATDGDPLAPHTARREWVASIATIQHATYQELLPMYKFTYTFSEGLTRPPTWMEKQLLRAVAENPPFTRQFLGIMTGATSLQAFQRSSLVYMARGLLPRKRNF